MEISDNDAIRSFKAVLLDILPERAKKVVEKTPLAPSVRIDNVVNLAEAAIELRGTVRISLKQGTRIGGTDPAGLF